MIFYSSFRKLAPFMVTFGLSLGATKAIAGYEPCDSLGAEVVFKDMLYGIGIGAVMGGLYLAATDSDTEASKVLARSGIAGGVLGIGAGIYEVSARDCNGVMGSRTQKFPLFTLIPKFSNNGAIEPAYGLTWKSDLF